MKKIAITVLAAVITTAVIQNPATAQSPARHEWNFSSSGIKATIKRKVTAGMREEYIVKIQGGVLIKYTSLDSALKGLCRMSKGNGTWSPVPNPHSFTATCASLSR
jgi:energy-converting hydrogenase Eha subunit A